MTLFETYQKFIETHPHSSVSFLGEEVRYRLFGHGPHTILALLGGSMLKTDAYFKMLLSLEDQYQIITVEYPTHLKSIKELIDRIVFVLGCLGKDSVYVLGASFGGGLAQALTRHYPNRVCGLILYNTLTKTNRMNTHANWVIDQVMEAILQIQELRDVMPLSIIKDALLQQIETALTQKEDLDLFESLIAQYSEADEALHMVLIKDLLTNYMFTREDFLCVSEKVLILYGHDDDPFGGSELIETLADIITHPKLEFIEADRFSLVTNPNPVTSAIFQFIK
jgi:pimeloyl-ACP methyl ester carboxylesterase